MLRYIVSTLPAVYYCFGLKHTAACSTKLTREESSRLGKGFQELVSLGLKCDGTEIRTRREELCERVKILLERIWCRYVDLPQQSRS
jgi:hypothetical protein